MIEYLAEEEYHFSCHRNIFMMESDRFNYKIGQVKMTFSSSFHDNPLTFRVNVKTTIL